MPLPFIKAPKLAKDIYDHPTDDDDDPHVQNTPLVNVKSYRRQMPSTAPHPRISASKDSRVVPDSQSEGERPTSSARRSDSERPSSSARRSDAERPSSSARRSDAERPSPQPKRPDSQRPRIVIELHQRKGPPPGTEIVEVDSDEDYHPPVEGVKKESVDRGKKKKPARNTRGRSSSKYIDTGDSSTPLESDDEGDGEQAGRITARSFTAHLSAEMVEPTREFLKALPDHKSRAQAWVRNYKTRAVNMDILKNDVLPWVPRSEDWTEEDHEGIRREWHDDPMRDKKIETKTNKDIHTLTKTCLLFFRCLPEHILSENDMEYDLGQNSTSKDGDQTLIWSAPFCKEMHALLPHAMFAGNIKLLATALQYVIMVETNDRRCWPMDTPVWDDFPKRMQALSRSQRTSKSRRSIVEIRKEVKSIGQQGGYAPSHWNMLFERIEQLLEKAANKKSKSQSQISQKPATLREDPFQPYKVHKRHLLCLKDALDQMGPFGFPAWMSTTLTAKAVNGSRPNDTFPTGKDFSKVRDRMYLYDMERSAHQAKLAAKAQGQPTSGSQQAQSSSIAEAATPSQVVVPATQEAQSSSIAEAATPSQVVVPATQQISKPGFKPNWSLSRGTKRSLSVAQPTQTKRPRQNQAIDQSRSPSRIPDSQTQPTRPSDGGRVIRAGSGHGGLAKQPYLERPIEPEAHTKERHDSVNDQGKQGVMQEHDDSEALLGNDSLEYHDSLKYHDDENPLQEPDSLDQHDSHEYVPIPDTDNQGDGSSLTTHPEAGVEQPLAHVPELTMSRKDLMYHYHRMPTVATNSQWLEVNAGSLDDGSDNASFVHPVLLQLKARPRQRVRASALPTPSDLYITDFSSTGLEELDSASQTLDPIMWTQPE